MVGSFVCSNLLRKRISFVVFSFHISIELFYNHLKSDHVWGESPRTNDKKADMATFSPFYNEPLETRTCHFFKYVNSLEREKKLINFNYYPSERYLKYRMFCSVRSETVLMVANNVYRIFIIVT